mgnify:CR=1 FL=1
MSASPRISSAAATTELTETWRTSQAGLERPGPAAVKPKLEDYDSEEEYLEAVTDWKIAGLRTELETKAHTDAAAAVRAREEQTIAQQYLDREAPVRQAHPDYDEVITTSTAEVSEEMQDAMLRSEVGPAIAYHLGKHPDEAARLMALTVGGMLKEMGRLEERLSGGAGSSGAAPSGIAARAAAVPGVTRAPRPIVPATQGAVRATKTVDDMTLAEYKEWRKQQGIGRG